jgi:hypothetical protein
MSFVVLTYQHYYSATTGTAGAKAYILRSVLSSSLISLMAKPKPIAQDGSTARVDLAAPTGGEGDGKVDCGALVDWQKGDGGPTGGIALVGLLWVVLGTILVHDRTMLEGMYSFSLVHVVFRSTADRITAT